MAAGSDADAKAGRSQPVHLPRRCAGLSLGVILPHVSLAGFEVDFQQIPSLFYRPFTSCLMVLLSLSPSPEPSSGT